MTCSGVVWFLYQKPVPLKSMFDSVNLLSSLMQSKSPCLVWLQPEAHQAAVYLVTAFVPCRQWAALSIWEVATRNTDCLLLEAVLVIGGRLESMLTLNPV